MECNYYVGQIKSKKCDRYIRMIDSATGKAKPHGWCGQYQCVHNPIYMARYDMYYNEEMAKEEEEHQRLLQEAISSQTPIPEPPSMTLEELNAPTPPVQSYANPTDILKALGMKEKETASEIPSTSYIEDDKPTEDNVKIIEEEKKNMEEEIKSCSDLKMLSIMMKDAEKKGYTDVALKAQKRINSLSNLQNLRKD